DVPPRTTAIGALAYYVSHAEPRNYQPTNITFGIMAPPDPGPGRRKVKRADRKQATSARALRALDEWIAAGNRGTGTGDPESGTGGRTSEAGIGDRRRGGDAVRGGFPDGERDRGGTAASRSVPLAVNRENP